MVECSKCGKEIGFTEKAYRHGGEPFCKECHEKLLREKEREKKRERRERRERRKKIDDEWEYKIVQLSTKESGLFMTKNAKVSGEEKLNELGKKGWELVSVVGIQAVSGGVGLTSQGSTKSVAFVLKRKYPDKVG